MTDLSKIKRIHCLGIGGIGLSAVAEILAKHGHILSGTDMKRSEITDNLEKKGIKIYTEHKAENVENVDAIVYSAAISEDNPEMVRARERGIPIFSRAEALGRIMEHYDKSIAICGTHGKTTTTSMTSLILRNAKVEPTIMVGGNLPQINGNIEIGKNKYFVTEACEYMDSFLNLYPKIGVVLNIDSDHLDYFKDIEHIIKSFRKFVTQIPEDGVVIAYNGNPFVSDILDSAHNTITYGYTASSDYYSKNIVFDDEGNSEYDLYHDGEIILHIHLSVPGDHNVLNSMAAIVVALYLGIDNKVIIDSLKEFTGTHRRFDVTGFTENGVKIVDDYAHHPTEIKATLNAASNVKHNKLRIVFQPHTYTRTLALFDDFADAFEGVDELIITDIYAAREKDIYNISSEKLVLKIKEKHPGQSVSFISKFEDIADLLRKDAKEGDMVITMGAGDVYKIGEMLLR